ncbi:MAG: hypothetical protein ACI8UO_003930 [Verrucomicrobiales bacterium]|jgi:hypothetical protein
MTKRPNDQQNDEASLFRRLNLPAASLKNPRPRILTTSENVQKSEKPPIPLSQILLVIAEVVLNFGIVAFIFVVSYRWSLSGRGYSSVPEMAVPYALGIVVIFEGLYVATLQRFSQLQRIAIFSVLALLLVWVVFF